MLLCSNGSAIEKGAQKSPGTTQSPGWSQGKSRQDFRLGMVARKMRTNTRKWSLASSIAGPFLQTVWSRVTEAWLKRQRSPCSPWVVAIGMVAIGIVANEDSRSVFILVWEIAKYQTVHSTRISPRNALKISHRYSHSVEGANNRVAEDGK